MSRSPAWLAASALVLFALAACTASPPVAAPGPAASAAPAPASLGSDQQFVDRAALGTASEVELGRLARASANSPAVRTFGVHITADHGQAHARLVALERRLRMAAATPAPAPGQFASLFTADFDRQFMADQVKNHQEAIALFNAEAQTGQDPRLRRFARDTLPMLYRGLREAEAITARLGG